MTEYKNKSGPLVSVLLPTYNRPKYLYQALSSVLSQSYENLQVIVINDGGTDVSDIIGSFRDFRIVFISRKQNFGKAFSLNEGLKKAEGKYLAYLDDDDIFYPDHIETLVNSLENKTDCHAAYSDLYKVYCKVSQDGDRLVLSKTVEVSRDFDRFFMLHFNHVLHVCLMHRRDLIEKTGPYNEKLNVLIDWDMTRRLAFFTDFYHICKITGEYYHPMGDCDRISVQQRKDKQSYLKNVLAIRTSRPAKPWTKIKDLSILFAADCMDKEAGKTIGDIWLHTFYPYQLYLPMSQSGLDRLNSEMPNLIPVPVGSSLTPLEKIDKALENCEGDYIAIVPIGFPVRERWVENSLYALINCSVDRQGFLIQGSTDKLAAFVIKKEDLQFARQKFPKLSVFDSLTAAGISLKHPNFEELPFQFDNLLQQAYSAENDGNWSQAAQTYLYIAEKHQNELWMKSLAANAFYKAGQYDTAARLCRQVNQQRPTVSTLLLEAKFKKDEKNYDSAIELLTAAQRSTEGHELLWT